MKSLTPKISVIIPCYNAEEYLQEALDSIINQTFKAIEIICVDDCSTDKTNEILQKNAEKDKRIKVFKNKKNMGVGKTANFAISKASSGSKYIARMDSDDVSLPTRLQEQWDYMEENPDIDISSTWYKILTEGETKDMTLPITHKKIIRKLFKSYPMASPSIIFRKSFIDKNHIRYGNMTTAEDYDLIARSFIEYNAKFGNIGKALLRYRVHPKQLTRNKSHKGTNFYSQEVRKYLRKHRPFQY